jgi:hypothetical protein
MELRLCFANDGYCSLSVSVLSLSLNVFVARPVRQTKALSELQVGGREPCCNEVYKVRMSWKALDDYTRSYLFVVGVAFSWTLQACVQIPKTLYLGLQVP